VSRFDDNMGSTVPCFLADFGDTITYQPESNAANNKSIVAIPADGEPEPFPEASDTLEYRECEILISARNNTEGHVTPKIAGFAGQTPDKVIGYRGLDWFVVNIIQTDDAGVHRLVLRDKCIPA